MEREKKQQTTLEAKTKTEGPEFWMASLFVVIIITVNYSSRESNLGGKNIQGMEKSKQGCLRSITTKRGQGSRV